MAVDVADQRRRRTRRRSAGRRFDWAPYVFASPGALYLLALLAVPLGRGVWLSFTDTKLLNPNGGDVVGVQNYAELLSSGRLYDSILTTLLYSAGTVLGALVLGTAAALSINDRFAGRLLARTLLTLPWAVPTVAVALVFSWIYNVDSGAANRGLRALGIGEVGWLTDPSMGLISVTLASIWKVFPFVTLVVLAALQSVPTELREAASVDGANSMTIFRTVVLPHISPTMRIVALLMTIWSFRRFEIIWLLTGGGPADSTNTIVINVYREAFQNSNLGMAAAIGVIGLIMAIAVTIIYFIADRRREIG